MSEVPRQSVTSQFVGQDLSGEASTVIQSDSIRMEPKHDLRYNEDSEQYVTQAIANDDLDVSEIIPEDSTKLEPRNKLEHARDSILLYTGQATISCESEEDEGVGIGILPQGMSEDECDGFDKLKENPSAFVWDKVQGLANSRNSGIDSEDDEVNYLADASLDEPEENTNTLVWGKRQGLANTGCENEGKGTKTCKVNSSAKGQPKEDSDLLMWGGEQEINNTGSNRGNFSEDPKDSSEVVAHTQLIEEAKLEEGNSEDYLERPNACGIDTGRDLLLEELTRIENISDLHSLKRDVSANLLVDIKSAVAKLTTQVMDSYENACALKAEGTLMLNKGVVHFLETQEVKKTFYLKEITSATSELAEALMEDPTEFRKLQETVQTLYDLQTREVYFTRSSSNSMKCTKVGVGVYTSAVFGVVAVGLALGFNGEWMALLFFGLVIMFCVFLSWRGGRYGEVNVPSKKRALRAKML